VQTGRALALIPYCKPSEERSLLRAFRVPVWWLQSNVS
jgi:hypothetical protein